MWTIVAGHNTLLLGLDKFVIYMTLLTLFNIMSMINYCVENQPICVHSLKI